MSQTNTNRWSDQDIRQIEKAAAHSVRDVPLPIRVRVMTWNIHGGVGTDRCFDLDRICATIKHNAPDVAALQEVDSRRRVADARSPFELLRQAVGEHGIDAKSIVTADGEYGQMLVSRWPLSAP